MAESFYIFPLVKWLVDNFPNSRTLDVNPDNKIKEFKNFQEALINIGERRKYLDLERRDKFIEACEEYVNFITHEMARRDSLYKEISIKSNAMLNEFFSMGLNYSKTGLSKYSLKNKMTTILKSWNKNYGEKILALSNAIKPDNSAFSEYKENTFLIHNVSALLREYSKIAANNNDFPNGKISPDNSLSDNPEVFLEKTYVLYEYAKLIRVTASAVKDYPMDDIYGTILEYIIDYPHMTDSEAAQEIYVSERTYARKKKVALTLFETLLWGCDINCLLSVL